MYRCEVTGRLSKKNEKLNKIVIERRDRIYTKRVRNEETGKWEDVEIGRGWEIVKEINATDKGLAIWSGLDEESRQAVLRVNVNDRIHLEF